MAGLLQAPEDEVMAALADGGLAFLDPADHRWKTADEYLSGNVKTKLKQALLSGTGYGRNVDALQRVQPEDRNSPTNTVVVSKTADVQHRL